MNRRRGRTMWVLPALVAVAMGVTACGQSGTNVNVSVAVDFGPAGRAPAEKTIAVRSGSTVFEALRTAFPVATSGR